MDLKATKLKDISNKQANSILKTLLMEFQRYYPEMLDKCYILNTPIFFQDYWEHEIRPKISARTASKVILTGESKHQELLERVEHAKLPSLYGG